MSRQRTTINSRLANLGIGELVAAAVFVLLAARTTDAGPAAWSALIPLVVVLVQAGVYWLVRSRTAQLPAAMATTYRFLRVLDAGLLVLGLAGVTLWWPAAPVPGVVVAAVWLFGVVEYANYFLVRLAYPPRRWLSEVGRRRVPQLVKDLRTR